VIRGYRAAGLCTGSPIFHTLRRVDRKKPLTFLNGEAGVHRFHVEDDDEWGGPKKNASKSVNNRSEEKKRHSEHRWGRLDVKDGDESSFSVGEHREGKKGRRCVEETTVREKREKKSADSRKNKKEGKECLKTKVENAAPHRQGRNQARGNKMPKV